MSIVVCRCLVIVVVVIAIDVDSTWSWRSMVVEYDGSNWCWLFMLFYDECGC